MKKFLLLLLCIISSVGCTKETKEQTLRVYSPYPDSFIRPIIQSYEHETKHKVEVIHDSTQTLLSKIKRTPKDKRGDVFLGGSLNELSKTKGIIKPYLTSNQQVIDKRFKNNIQPFILMPSVFVVHQDLIGNIDLKTYQDLKHPQLTHHFAYPSPQLTNTGFQHNRAMTQLYGRTFTKSIFSKGIEMQKTDEVLQAVIDGKVYAGLTYEYTAMDFMRKGYPIEMIYPSDGTIINVDGVALVQNGKSNKEAKQFIDYLLSRPVQSRIAQSFHVKSIRNDIQFKPIKGVKALEDIHILNTGDTHE